jgi:RNA polymerase sigma factor (sigma-70 family)
MGVPVSDAKPEKLTKKLTEEQVMDMVMALLRKIPPEQQAAALLLTMHLTKRLERFYMRKGMPEADAEELTIDTWMKLLSSRFEGKTRPVVWLWTIANSVWVDYLRSEKAQKHGDAKKGTGEVAMDLDDFAVAVEKADQHGAPDHSGHIDMQRLLEAFSTRSPEDAEILDLKVQGFEDQEIAETLGFKGGSAIRDRILRARNRFKQFYTEFQEGAQS